MEEKMFKKKEPKTNMGQWTEAMLSCFKEEHRSFGFSPTLKETNINIEDNLNYHQDAYSGKAHWHTGEDVYFHLIILDDDVEFGKPGKNMGYFRLTNYLSKPRIYIYIKNENGIRGAVSELFRETALFKNKLNFVVSYEKEFVQEMSDENMIGNKEVNNIPIKNLQISTIYPSAGAIEEFLD
jgi:hypothetical protein